MISMVSKKNYTTFTSGFEPTNSELEEDHLKVIIRYNFAQL